MNKAKRTNVSRQSKDGTQKNSQAQRLTTVISEEFKRSVTTKGFKLSWLLSICLFDR